MKTIALDTETFLIAPGRAAPRMVCTSYAFDKHNKGLLHAKDPKCRALWIKALKRYRIIGLNIAYDMAVVLNEWPELANLIFDAYAQGRIEDIKLNQRLLDIENGCLEGKWAKGKRVKYRYSLKALAERLLLKFRQKGEDSWQLRYGSLYHETDCNRWPSDARKYAIDDAADLLPMDEIQQAQSTLRNSGAQAFADFALHLMSCRGIITDPVACNRLIKATQAEIERCRKLCIKHELINPVTGKKSIKDARARLLTHLGGKARLKELKHALREREAQNAQKLQTKVDKIKFDFGLSDQEYDAVCSKLERLQAKNISHKELLKRWPYDAALYIAIRSLEQPERAFTIKGIRCTKKGAIKVDAEACKASGDPVLKAYATYTSAKTLLKKTERMMLGSRIPLQTSYQSLIETGRTSSRANDAPLVGDNFQNFRRNALKTDQNEELPGQRECIIARPGYVLCSIDFDAAEMRSFAQLAIWQLGYSRLAEVLNAGRDPHLALAAKSILRISYERAQKLLKAGDKKVKQARQYAKIPNFALLGGGGWSILSDFAKAYDIVLTDDAAKELYEAFHEAWTEVRPMHKYFGSFVHKQYTHPISKRRRYLTRYAQACNNPFQGLTADAAKYACTLLAREMYSPSGSLYGSYAVLFQHDEVIFELDEQYYSEHAWRAAKIMVDAYNAWTPDVRMTAQPAIMRRFAKGAETITHPTKLDADGNKLLLVYGDKYDFAS